MGTRRRLLALVLLIAAVALVTAPAQAKKKKVPPPAVMIADLFKGVDSSYAAPLGAVGNTVFFFADDGVHGNELWTTQGTKKSTKMVADLTPGPGSTSGGDAVTFDSQLFLPLTAGANGSELWKSDGTAAGTAIVDDTAGERRPDKLTVSGDSLYFIGEDEPHGREIFRTDGTSVSVVKDLTLGSVGSNPQDIASLGDGDVIFCAIVAGEEDPYISDGTEAGTKLLFDLDSGMNGGAARDFTKVGDNIFFFGYTAAHGSELWVSNGIPAGDPGASTFEVVDAMPGPDNGIPLNLTPVGRYLFFMDMDPAHGQELWRSDGTSAGTAMVADIRDGSIGSSPSNFTATRSRLIFTADDGDGPDVWTIWLGGMEKLEGFASPFLIASGEPAYLSAIGDHGYELWRTDGSAEGTSEVMDINPGGNGSPANGVRVGSQLYFTADDGVHGRELWRTN